MAEPLSLEMHDQHAAALEQQQNPLDTLRAAFETTAEQLNNQRDILKAANTILRLRGADAHVQGIAAEAATQISTLRPRVIDDEIRYRQTEMTQLEPRVLPVIAEDERLAFIDNHLKANEVRLDSPVYNAIQTELGRHPTRADLEKMKADILSRRAKEKNEIEEKLADATIVRYMETDGKKAGARFMGRSGSAEIRAHIDARMKIGEPIDSIIASLNHDRKDLAQLGQDKATYLQDKAKVSELLRARLQIQDEQRSQQTSAQMAEQQVMAQLRQSFASSETG